jgi:hypothetical protein
VQSDGRIVLGGADDYADGYVGRLLANGAIDPGFDAGVVPGRFTSVTALAIGAAGSIFVTGSDRAGFSGALVVRLLADGTLDTLFGRAGATSVDLKTRRASSPAISDMKVVDNDGLVVGGNSGSYWSGGGTFVARLLGNAGGGSPGILSMQQASILRTEQDGRAVLSVHRTGGSAGAVAVTYATRDFPVPSSSEPNFAPGERATGGADYTAATGRLTWADVEIAGASYPVGDLTIVTYTSQVSEGNQTEFYVFRNFYSQGAVSVTVRVAAGSSATAGQDFSNPGSKDWQDVVLTWADGEMGAKYLPVLLAADGTAEQVEAFTLELVSPTGGAALGDAPQATVRINDTPPPPPPPPPPRADRGGGSFGWLGALLFGLGGALHRRRIRNR